ncbi:S-methyl-5-thioribose kinase [Vagococcus fluvialis]|uniref:S-methyl-5-thioribose kinase n=1 Tax=Vagococcus fluvialis TaxID=2738 RepID=UPI001D09CD2F|nr:S-methyl-5-thioribose kinase [Vagococcus fluvialis]UDM71561.1 S-methyl-5-thioribose kinase [Vagococcus fluvialis]UDM76422.1 S-methyl-5-thioribose kinase [Vagococcus fluvialis]UDM83252.1 S-methyl-5-thioribose kinase [Vagococcus fluvialis]
MAREDFTQEYFRFNEQDAIDYSVEILNYFDSKDGLECLEIGDGNLNYIFKVYDELGKSVIIKQAGPIARISDDIKLSPDRNRIESEILKIQYELTGGGVPKVYNYDSKMNCTAMEDLSDHIILRTGLLNYQIFPNLADQLAVFMVETLLPTSDVVMEHKEKKDMVKNFINAELCEISEDLVFTEPYYDAERNDMLPETQKIVSELIWQDRELKLAVAKLKFDFMTNAEALIHGDLHSGSIFAKKDSAKVIDPEFAFYGPAGYDVGNVLAHFIFSILNAKYSKKASSEFIEWIHDVLGDTLDKFSAYYNQEWDRLVIDEMAKIEGFKESYLSDLLADTASFAGTEIIRRIIGLAHVEDIVSLPKEQRLLAEKEALLIGKKLILESKTFKTGQDYLNLFK